MEFFDFPALGAGFLRRAVDADSDWIWKSIDYRPYVSVLKNCRRI
jgi:hypothetical protein